MTRHALTTAAVLLVALGVWLLAGLDLTGPARDVTHQPGTVIHGTPAPSTPAPTPTEGAYSHAV